MFEGVWNVVRGFHDVLVKGGGGGVQNVPEGLCNI